MAADQLVEERAADLDLGRAFHELELSVLELADRPAERLALLRVGDRVGEHLLGRGLLGRAPADLVGGGRIGAERQVRPMLLDRADRDDDDRALPVRGRDIGRAQIPPIPAAEAAHR